VWLTWGKRGKAEKGGHFVDVSLKFSFMLSEFEMFKMWRGWGKT
jgi:hypothetical protein